MLSEKAVARVSEVFLRADLGDARLVRRAVGLVESLAKAPERSLPKVWAATGELQAGYDFLRNPRTDFTVLMEPVQHATRERALQEHRVLVLHDTTDVTCPVAAPEEVGFLQTGKPGFYVHHALCVSADGTKRPLGVLWSQLWGRPQRSKGRGRRLPGSELAKLKERESDRWLEGVSEAQLWAEGCEAVHVMDREADSFRLLHHMHELGADFVVRLRHDRGVEEGSLSESLSGAALKLRRAVAVSAREAKTMPRYTHKARSARETQLVVRCASVQFRPPNYMRKADPIELNVVQVLEENPPAGADPIAWVLATTLPITSRAQVEYVIDAYRARWVIEEFHKALKTGCLFEKRQLESFSAITTLLALCYPIACELLRLRSRARQPDLPATELLRKSQLDCLRAHPKARVLPENPSAQQALAVIAALGGHLPQNGPPGWQTLSAGYMELLAFERGWLAALNSR